MKRELKNAAGRIFLTITYEPATGWVYNNWLGSQCLASVQQGADASLEVVADNESSQLLNDNRLVAGPWSQATEWLVTHWVPRALTAGLTHFAHITSPEPLARLSAENLHHRIRGAFQMQIFNKKIQAEEWLQQAQAELIVAKR
ncbi:hypothetical protein [Adhaeribacter arboris]|uniref:hypothetical protein n=1 Tax=Adhaeribacter arboris TaxID=2072846 RepID=UPI0011B22FB8|nr:hypothetical protein [Adhaeribacter arboris]